MNNESVSNIVGNIGECIVAEGHGFFLSGDAFDRKKDLWKKHGDKIITAEVKTQSRYSGMFTIGENQLEKCTNVDRLYFVEFDKSDDISVYLCEDVTRFKRYTTAIGKRMIGFDISKMKLAYVKNCRILSEMLRYYSRDYRYVDHKLFQQQ